MATSVNPAPYVPSEPPSIGDTEAIVGWLLTELRAISGQFNECTALELRLTGVAPLKPREGMIVAADGVNWNPGAGKGVYTFLTGAWVKMS